MKYIKFFNKWKLAVAALFVISAPYSLVSPEQSFYESVIVAIVCLLVAVALMLSDILYIKTPADKLWKRWTFVEGEKAQARKERAAYGELTPTYIDTE